MKNHTIYLNKLNACSDAVKWADQFKSMQEVWDNCKRGDWMLWLAGKVCGGQRSKSRKVLVSAACEYARTAWKWMSKEGKKTIPVFFKSFS